MNKLLKFFIYTSLLTSFTLSQTLTVQALDEDEILITNCPITPQIWQIKSSPYINKTNNLRRKPGSSEIANGDFITITGRITDENCVPVTNAVVEIWHLNSKGIDPFNTTPKQNNDLNFLGSGTSITDNLGYYKFLTIFPGSSEKTEAPKINFRIKHADFLPFETVMYFENQFNNDSDKLLKTQVEENKQQLLLAKAKKINNNDYEEGIEYHFNLTLEGKSKYKKY